jgi:TolA-binding protein
MYDEEQAVEEVEVAQPTPAILQPTPTEAIGAQATEAARPSRSRVLSPEAKEIKELKAQLAAANGRITDLTAEVQTQAGKAEFYFKKCNDLLQEKAEFNKAISEGVQLFAQSLDVAFKHLSNTLGGK